MSAENTTKKITDLTSYKIGRTTSGFTELPLRRKEASILLLNGFFEAPITQTQDASLTDIKRDINKEIPYRCHKKVNRE